MNNVEKKSFLVYLDWRDRLHLLSDKEYRRFFDNLFSYHLGEELVLKTKTDKILWEGVLIGVKVNQKKYDLKVAANQKNGKLGGRPTKINNPNNPNNPDGYFDNPNNPIKEKREKVKEKREKVNEKSEKEIENREKEKEKREKENENSKLASDKGEQEIVNGEHLNENEELEGIVEIEPETIKSFSPLKNIQSNSEYGGGISMAQFNRNRGRDDLNHARY